MADNTTLNLGSGGDVIASDDIAGVKYQRVKLSCGADGAATDVPVGGGVEAAALRVTLASDSTGVLSVDDNGSTLSIDDGGGAITVDGTVTANLAAGTNNIGDVDVLSVVPGTAATSLGKAVDSAAGATDTGVALLAIRDDALTTLTPVDGDYVALRVSSTGALHVTGSAGTTQYTEDAASAGGESLCLMGAVRRDTAASSSGTDGDYSTLNTDATGNLRVAVSAGGVAGVTEDAVASGSAEGVLGIVVRDDALSTLTPVDGDYTVQRTNARGATWVCLDSTAAQNVTVAAALPAGTNNIGDVDILSIAAGDNNIGNVDIVTMPNVTLAAGTNTNEVVGDAAHDAAIAGNPVRIGARAMSADFTAVATGDTTDVLATLLGKQVVVPYALPGAAWTYASPAAVTDTADDEAKAAVASTRNYVTGVQVFNGHDTVGTEVVIKDGATVLWRGWAEQTGGGCSARFDPPLRGTANTAINVANITTGSSTYFNLQGFAATE